MTSEDAIKLRQDRRARIRKIRGRVVGYSVALFVAVWAVIAVVLATGHDPALSRTTATSAAVTTTTPATTTSGSSDDGSSNAVTSGSVSPVTSSQS